MAISTIADVVTAIATQIATGTALNDGFFPRVRDLIDTPISLEQGDCPQIFFLPQRDKQRRLTFDAPDSTRHEQRDFTVLGYYIDEAENLDQPWGSRPRTALWCDAFVAKSSLKDNLGITDLYCEVSAEVRDGLKYNGIPFRGGIIAITGYYFG